MADRQAATQKAVELLSKFAGYNDSVKEIERMLESLSDEQFDAYMEQLQNGETILPYIAPNLNDIGLSNDTNLQIAEELGHEFFEHLWITDPSTGQTYRTPHKYLVVDLPIKRLQQHLEKKLRVPENNRFIDERTGQPARNSPSKGSSLSFPELQVLYSQGLDRSIEELFQVRGGDLASYREFEQEAIEGGNPSIDATRDPDSRAKSSDTINILLKSAHIDNNL